MKKEIIGILICILLTSVAVAPAMNAFTNEINEDSPLAFSKNVIHSNSAQYQVSESESNRKIKNNVKLNPPQPTPWPPDDKCFGVGFGQIYNVKHECAGFQCWYSFNCKNVICSNYGESWFTWHHFTNGEVLYLYGAYIGIITDNFLFILLS